MGREAAPSTAAFRTKHCSQECTLPTLEQHQPLHELPEGFPKLPTQLRQQGNIHQEGHRKAKKQSLNTFDKNLCVKHFRENLMMQVQQNQSTGVMLEVQLSLAVPRSCIQKLLHFPTIHNRPLKTHPIRPKPGLNLLRPVVPLTCWQLRLRRGAGGKC